MGKPSKNIFGILSIADCNKAIANTIDTFIVFCIFDKGPIPISTTLAIFHVWEEEMKRLEHNRNGWRKLLHQCFQENFHANKETLSQKLLKTSPSKCASSSMNVPILHQTQPNVHKTMHMRVRHPCYNDLAFNNRLSLKTRHIFLQQNLDWRSFTPSHSLTFIQNKNFSCNDVPNYSSNNTIFAF